MERANTHKTVINMTVINETVKAARDYLHSPAGEAENDKLRATRRPKDGYDRESEIIALFLDWDLQRVKEALAEIGEIEYPKLTEPERATKKEITGRRAQAG